MVPNIIIKPVCIIIIFSYIFVAGCASYVSTRQAPLNINPIAQQNKKISDDTESMVFPITTQNLQKQIFDTNLTKKGYLPVQISIVNKKDCNLTFDKDGVVILSPEGVEIPRTSNLDVARDTDKSIGRTVGWTVAFGVVGLIPSALNVSKTNKRIQADYVAKAPIEGNLVPGGMVDGILFFKLPDKKIKSLNDYKINIVLHDELRNEDINITHALYGDIEYEGSKEDEDDDEKDDS